MAVTGILQLGLGNFGRRHLAAWQRLGLADRLWVAEPDTAKWSEAAPVLAPGRCVRSAAEALAHVSIVDIVTPTEHHLGPCREALEAGKDVFIEKPMMPSAAQAREIAELVERTRRRLQVGYYYRFHPAAQWLKAELAAGRFGGVRYVTGEFLGFKRARTDVGVMHTDGIHFLDLFNWLLGGPPEDVYAVCRDHFRRGLEDFAIALLTYAGGTVGKVEAGYIQPGQWEDKVVAGAMTTKRVTLVGERATAEIDFEAETLIVTDARHEFNGTTWAPVLGHPTPVALEPCDPVEMVCRELTAFIQAVEHRTPTAAGPVDSGLHLAVLMERFYESHARRQPQRLELTEVVPST